MTVSLYKRQFLLGAVSTLIVPAGMAAAADSAMHTVEIHNLKFLPEVVVVRPGDRVRWINRDIAPHTATALNESWDTGELGLGDGAEIEITGDIATDYYCAFHPHMWGQIKVT